MPPLLATNLLNVHIWHWFAFAGLVVALLTLDLVVFHRRVHTPTWVSLSVVGLLLLASVVASVVFTDRAKTPAEPYETEQLP